jgi:hypothetical protein
MRWIALVLFSLALVSAQTRVAMAQWTARDKRSCGTATQTAQT